MTEGTFDPHGHARVLQAGAPLYRAKAAVVMLHGRGSEAGNMLEFAEILAQPDLTYLAPQAKDRSWYPYSFLAPIDRNEPFLSSALKMLGHLLDRLDSEHHLGADQIVLLNFPKEPALLSNMQPGTRATMEV
jgi:hypothetical protein